MIPAPLAASTVLAGAAALVFEVLWVRLVALSLGHAAPAVSAVLSAFMAGLAAGAWAAGRLADRRSPAACLRLYAACEAGAGLLGLASRPVLLAAGGFALRAGVAAWGVPAQAAAAFAASALLLAPPAALMGASLPLLTRALKGDGAPERALAPLYGLNTAGALAGCLLGGLVLLPGLGLARSLWTAAAAEAAAAALAWAASGRASAAVPPAPARPSPAPAGPMAVLALTGAAALACETAWTRALALLAGSTTYAFTAVVAVVLAGLAAGSAAFSRRRGRGDAGLAALLAALASLLGLTLAAYDRLPWLVAVVGSGLPSPALAFVCAVLLAAPAAALMGAVLPWVVSDAAPASDGVGRAVGGLYAANTAGAIVGAAAAGLVLLPLWGWRGTLAACAVLYAALAARLARRAGRPRAAAAAAAAGVLALALARGSARLEASGMFVYGRYYKEAPSFADFKANLDQDRVVFHETGRDATVTVLESPHGERFLRVNGKTDASEGGDMSTQLLLGYLPSLWGPPAPRRALVVGLGAGLTAAALAGDRGLAALDVVEIEPAVARAARLFSRSNRGVLDDPRLRLVTADARQVLASPGPSYDLVVSEPSNPWIAGIAALFTREAFAQARARLAPGGVFCQWFHSYHMRPEDFRLVARTFASVFPHAVLLGNGEADYFLVGSDAPLSPDYARFEARFKDDAVFRADMRRLGGAFDRPFLLLVDTFVLGDADLRRWAGAGPLHEDDRPVLEARAARSIGLASSGDVLAGINAAKSSWMPPGTRNIKVLNRDLALLFAKAAEALLDDDKPGPAAAPVEKALRYDTRCARAWTAYGRWLDAAGRAADAEKALRKGVALEPSSPDARARLGVFLYAKGRPKEAHDELLRARALEPGNPLAALALGWVTLEGGDAAAAAAIIEEALAQPVPDPRMRADLASTLKRARSAAAGR